MNCYVHVSASTHLKRILWKYTPLMSIRRNLGMMWAQLAKSKFTAITHHTNYLFKVFIVLFIKLLIYISTDWTFTTAVNTPHVNSLWVNTVYFHVKFPVSFCTPVAFFFFLWQQSSTFTCADAISMKKCFCTKRIKIL